MTTDHKPSVYSELTRICKSGGRVERFKTVSGQEYGPYRLWLKNEVSPGLAMSRSFGDAIAATVGLIAEPDIEEIYIESKDKYLVLATDGVWDKLSNKEVAKIALKYMNADTAVEEIVQEARKKIGRAHV